MGEVYRARDTKLNRDVALKVIPDTFALDLDRLARFKREAQVLASLNHPNIAAIYGFEDSGETHALVLELVEGETLADRIAHGAIPLDEALPIARQICEALEAAHEQGIIHRDLKPANIKVTPDGVVKVLDFGLAKLEEPAGSQPAVGGAHLSEVPTITSPAMMTGVGVILGTAAYMAPEQAKGREADTRSDIWAFGCVLYEMLTGKGPFAGDDVSDTLANVLKREPDWSALPATVPVSIRALLHRCLEKDRRKRVADVSTALFVIDEQASLSGSVAASAAPPPRGPLWRRVAALTAGALVVAAVGGAAVWFATRPSPPRVSRLLIAPSGAAALTIDGLDRDLAITPDGSRVVYVGNRGTQLFVRALDALEPVAVFTGAPHGPFVSPDGQWIGFVDGIATLKKVALTGGPAVTLATLDGNARRGATWAPDDTIIVATNNASIGLLRVAATGRPPTVLTRPDRVQGELNHAWPELLPGGRAVLFTITAVTGGLDAAQVAVLDLQTGTRKVLVRGGSHARYAPSGHLVYAAAGTLRAVAFDLATLETRGTPVLVVTDVVTTLNNGGVDAVVASDGTLAYVLGGAIGADGGAPRTLVWVDRQGRETPIPAPPRAYLYPRLSLDARRVAVSAADREADIWIWDLSRTTLTRATFHPRLDTYPVWTPNGRRLIFGSERAGARNLYWQAADGTGAVERLTESPNQQNPAAVAPDGRRLIFTETAPKTAEDVMQVELDGTHRVTALVQSPFAERNGIVSPDGRWLAYEANESGRFEISVRPFPEVNSGHWQVSTAGGTRPLWAPGGQELFYASPTGALMRVGVERASSWAATTPTLLVKEGYFTIPGGTSGRTYDIASDGQRFLMIKEAGGTDQTAAPPQIIVVQHWTEELKRLVPTK
jgi:Tol biopolymer transport system component